MAHPSSCHLSCRAAQVLTARELHSASMPSLITSTSTDLDLFVPEVRYDFEIAAKGTHVAVENVDTS